MRLCGADIPVRVFVLAKDAQGGEAASRSSYEPERAGVQALPNRPAPLFLCSASNLKTRHRPEAVMSERISPRLSCWIVAAIFGFAAIPTRAAAQDLALELNPAETTISFAVHASLHTVHGTLKLKNGTIHFNPATGAASGLVVVDTTSGDTGNRGRDRKMHREVLESAKYPEATFSPIKFSGAFRRQGESTVDVSGILRLHGSEHQVTLSFPVQADGNVLSATTHLVIPYVAWGLKNPSTFILRVSDQLDMDVKTSGRVTAPNPGATAPK